MTNILPTTLASKQNWIAALIQRGDQTGRTIGFPSLNFDPNLMPKNLRAKPGVYSCQVQISHRQYLGALYYGPRLIKGETHSVLEIHVLDFSGEIYGQIVEFRVGKFIRPPMNFASLVELKKQLTDDVARVRGTA